MNFKSALSAAKTVVTSKTGRQMLVLKKHSPSIMFGTGVVGMIGTTVLASRATLRLDDVFDGVKENEAKAQKCLDANLENYSPQDYTRDMAIIKVKGAMEIAKLYAPAIALGALSIGLLTGAHVTLNRRNASLAAAYAAVDKAFDQYRDRVKERFGEETDDELRYGYETKVEKDKDTGEVKKTHTINTPSDISQYARFFDELNKNWDRHAEYNKLFIQCQQNYANNLLKARGHIFLNEVYDMLGMERSKAGAVVGWVLGEDGDNYVDFGLFNADREAVREFVNGNESSILLDFNVDGVIYDKI